MSIQVDANVGSANDGVDKKFDSKRGASEFEELICGPMEAGVQRICR
ncbi:hypothetical protein [Rosistilla oblonga]